ncbi:MAG TPA: hypothetical protein DC017_14650 [Candidatus Wallbacteria bacterium]|nr:hypothetical protein [Candidatus Wallbacteria bacterium]
MFVLLAFSLLFAAGAARATGEAALENPQTAEVTAAAAAPAEPDIEAPAELKIDYNGSPEQIKTLCEHVLKARALASKDLEETEARALVMDSLAQLPIEKLTLAQVYVHAVALGEKRFDMSHNYFNPKRSNVLIAGILLLSFIGYFTYHARQGKDMFIRKIAGLSAIDEAVGRATEMGKPVLFVPGIYDMDDIQTIAGVSILGHVAKKTAEYETNLLVPCTRSLVMSTSQEVVREAYLKAGRIDSFKAENIRYLTDDQFGYVAGVDGIMMREKPAANFYLGVFFAESLILAETGHHVGAIQIAGTAMVHQIPFFVAACDYTLIGEELFAASAYLTREPMQLGTLKGQDVGKFLIIIVIVLGIVLETCGITFFSNWFITH